MSRQRDTLEIHLPPRERFKSFPALITIHDYLRPVQAVECVIGNIERRTTAGENDQLNLQGHFILAYSAFEAMCSALTILHLTEHPNRLEPELRVQREHVTHSYSVRLLVKDLVSQRATSLSYAPPSKQWKHLCDLLGIPQFSTPDRLTRFKEIKEARDLLVHRGLDMDGSYLDRADRTPDQLFSKVKIAPACMTRAARLYLELTSAIRAGLQERYGHLTRLHVLQEVWKFMIGPTPVVRFDDFWKTNEETDSVEGYIGTEELENKLSHSERMIFQMWRAHYGGATIEFHMRSLDNENTQKLLWFLEAMKRIWVY